MDDREFFDRLMQMWTKTTGADDRFWQPVAYDDPSGRFYVYAVGQDQSRKLVGSSMSDSDSDWVTAIHGCFPDLWRRLHRALDEADEADYARDSRECRIAELEMEVAGLRKKIEGKPWHERG